MFSYNAHGVRIIVKDNAQAMCFMVTFRLKRKL